MPSFDVLQSEPIYQGKAFRLRRDTVKMPDGREARLDIVEHTGSVVMIPIDAEGDMVFVRQYRHPTRLDMLELPAGTRDGDEPPQTCAAREMREETGMAAGHLEELGAFYLAPGYSTEFMHVFLATELTPNPLPPDSDEFLRVEKFPVRRAMEMAEQGKIQDAKTLAALLLARSSLMKYLMD